MNLEDNLNYKQALEELKKYHQEPLGLTDYQGTSQSHKTYPKQYNIEIALLIKIYRRLERIEQILANISLEKEIDKIIENFSKILVNKNDKKITKI